VALLIKTPSLTESCQPRPALGMAGALRDRRPAALTYYWFYVHAQLRFDLVLSTRTR